MNEIQNNAHEIIDRAEELLTLTEPVVMPLKHRFTDGMYIREIFMPAGTLLTSKIHKTNHPFVVTSGKCIVYDGDKTETITAPYTGITQPNTRRLLYIEEDTTWITFHATNKTDVAEIEKEIIIDRKNDLVDQELLDKFSEINRQDNTYINNNKEELLCHGQQ
jgi:hypothetical protein